MLSLIDIPTVLLVAGVYSLLAGVVLYATRPATGRFADALLWHATSLLLTAGSLLFYGGRAAMPQWISFYMTATLSVGGAIMILQGTRVMFGQPWQPRLTAVMLGANALVFLALGFDEADIALRTVVVTAAMGACSLFAARIAFAHADARTRPAALLYGTVAGGFGVLSLVRAVATAVGGVTTTTGGVLAYSPAQAFFALVYATSPLLFVLTLQNFVNATLRGELERLAHTDPLTGLDTRRVLFDRADDVMERSRARGDLAAVLMIDIDQFKAINDRHGHLTGDAVLRHVAGLLRASLRSDAIVVRYGGEEFCAVVPVQQPGEAFAVAERLRRAVEQAPYRSPEAVPVTATLSIGVAVHDGRAALADLLADADRCVYRAKTDGRNRVVAGMAVLGAPIV